MRPITFSMLAVTAIGISLVVFGIGMMRQNQADGKGLKTRLPSAVLITAGSLTIMSPLAEWLGIQHEIAIALGLIGVVLVPIGMVTLVVVNLR